MTPTPAPSPAPTPVPTGRLLRTADGVDLVLTRGFALPVEEVWAALTESARTALWFGPWEGDGGPGTTARVRLLFEEETPWTELRVEACEAPTRLVVTTVDEAGSWRLELKLSGTSGDGTGAGPDATELTFVQHLSTEEGVGEIGPGWEYYLDKLRASLDGGPQPVFEDYYPAQKAYFEDLTAE
ncbi:SRPBCC domain-containing protein [Streptomyces niveus]|uniref:SRPBCC domain-containing protein n=1 Tax=Streptomyces niveus TaxID=193462 RepID=UPI0034494655